MRDQLIQYVNLLFAGAQNCEDTRQEILQNTLDRYDDLTAEGKTPEAAYRLAIMGIGDINEILGSAPGGPVYNPVPEARPEKQDSPRKKILRAVAVCLYIICPIPLFVLGEFPGLETYGLCGTLAIVAVATALMMLGAKKEAPRAEEFRQETKSPENELKKSVSGLIWAMGIAAYFILSFLTRAWYITWVMFLIIPAVQGLVSAVMDLKEES